MGQYVYAVRQSRIGAIADIPWRRYAVHLPAAFLVGFYFIQFSLYSLQIYWRYGDPPFDLALFDQGIWLMSRFHDPFVTVMGRNLFGDHTCFILVVLVPVYWVWPHVEALLVIQAGLIAGAAVPLYLLALKRLESALLGAAMVAVFLLNPALQQGNLEQFHPEAFAVLGLSLALYAALEWKPKLLIVGVVMCLLVKQDTGLLIIPLGIWLAFRGHRKLGVAIVIAGAAWQLLAFEVIIYAFLGTTSFQADRIPFGGAFNFFKTVVFHFHTFWKFAVSQQRPFYIWQLGISFGWVFLLAPEIAAIELLNFGENWLSNFPYQHQIIYHYSMPQASILAVAVVWGIGRWKSEVLRMVLVGIAVISALVASTLWGISPFAPHTNLDRVRPRSTDTAAMQAIEKEIPPNAIVSAWYPYVSHIDHRTQIYMWPTPFAATDWSLYQNPGARLPFAGKVQYLMLSESGAQVDDVFLKVAPGFHLIDKQGDVALYKKNGT